MKPATSLLLIVCLSLSPALSHVALAATVADTPVAAPASDDELDEPMPDAARATAAGPILISEPAIAASLRLAIPERLRVHREKLAAIGLAASSAGLLITGGPLISAHYQSDAMLDSGIALTATGGVLAFSTFMLGSYSAGHDSGLRLLPHFLAAAPDRRWAMVDAAEADARIEEHTGMALFFSGLALFGGGLGMVMGGLQGVSLDEGGGGNSGLLIGGIAISLLGDAMWLSGMFVWAHGGGKHRGVREAREALSITPTGIIGRF